MSIYSNNTTVLWRFSVCRWFCCLTIYLPPLGSVSDRVYTTAEDRCGVHHWMCSRQQAHVCADTDSLACGEFSLENLVLFIPSSGYVFYGGLLGVILAISLYTRKDRDLRTRIYHMVTPAFPLFHGFGRIGCFMAGCCYGIPLPAPITFFGMFTLDRLPVQIFEAVFEFVLFAVLLVVEKRRPQTDILKVYLLAYAVFRFAIEFFRGDVVRGIFLGLSTAQWVSLGIAVYYLLQPFKTRKTMAIADATPMAEDE